MKLIGEDSRQSGFQTTLKEISEFSNYINANFVGQIQATSPRKYTAFALFHLSLNHFEAVTILIGANLATSASAILRPQWEAWLRGCYIGYCATEDSVRNIFLSDKWPKLSDLANRVSGWLDSADLQKINQDNARYFHASTHGGRDLARRVVRKNCEFDETELVAMLSSAKSVAILAACQICILEKNEHLLSWLMREAEKSNNNH